MVVHDGDGSYEAASSSSGMMCPSEPQSQAGFPDCAVLFKSLSNLHLAVFSCMMIMFWEVPPEADWLIL